eukprot:m.26004 g.26004  ORF g.26004 m.26004 type:complete len:96 (-) comp7758_c0_seq2:977-1264(-)
MCKKGNSSSLFKVKVSIIHLLRPHVGEHEQVHTIDANQPFVSIWTPPIQRNPCDATHRVRVANGNYHIAYASSTQQHLVPLALSEKEARWTSTYN